MAVLNDPDKKTWMGVEAAQDATRDVLALRPVREGKYNIFSGILFGYLYKIPNSNRTTR